MICNKCNHKLPDDSEFCQYCGNKIEKVATTPVEEAVEEPKIVETPVAAPAIPVVSTPPVVEDEPNIDDMTPDEALTAILKIQAKNTVEAMEANSKTQPNNEGDADFGLVPEKPIFTLALMSVDGEKEYLNRLYTASGEKIKYNRLGSTSVDGINGMIDIYETFLPSGQPYKTIYINMYGAKKSTKAPAGFVLKNPTVQAKPVSVQKKEIPVKIKYCSRCGSVIDSKTKICTGCGKQYFRGFRFTKFSITVIALALVIATVSTLWVLQYINTQELKDEIGDLEKQVSTKQSTINRLESKVDDLEDQVWENRELVSFVDDYVVFVEDDGTDCYHKFDCHRFKGESFWVFNIEAARGRDYTACPYCN